MTNANDLAHPFCWENTKRENGETVAIVTANQSGLTKLEDFAKAAMMGILASGRVNVIEDAEQICNAAVAHAKSLIYALNKK